MGRGGSRGRSRSPSNHAPAPRHAPPPAAAPPAPQQGGGMVSNLAGSVVSGIGTGVGFSVANRAVDAVMGPRQTEVVHTHQPAPPAAPPAVAPAAVVGGASSQQVNSCKSQLDDLNQCLARHSDASLCQPHFESLKMCQNGGSEFA